LKVDFGYRLYQCVNTLFRVRDWSVTHPIFYALASIPGGAVTGEWNGRAELGHLKSLTEAACFIAICVPSSGSNFPQVWVMFLLKSIS
jgi:hypothetical protein